MAKYLLDTNHLARAVSARSPLLARMLEQRRAGDRFGTCVPVLCEIEVGRVRVKDPHKYKRLLDKLLHDLVTVWPMNQECAEFYGAVYAELKAKGRALSQVDMMIAAMARQGGLIVLTTDRDFEALPDIPTENWL